MKRIFLVMLIAAIYCIMTTSALADPPANDSCANATDAGTLVNGEEIDLTGTIVDAGQDCDSTDGAEVWVQFTISDCMDVTIDFCEDENTVLEDAANYLFSECPCGDRIDASDNGYCGNYNPIFNWYSLPAGTYYYPIVANTLGSETYTVSITGEDCPEVPDNDDCANAISVGEVTELAYTTLGASLDGDGTCMSSPNVWYVYTSTFTGDARVTLDTDYSEKLAVYNGADCSSLPTELGCTNFGYLDFAVVTGGQYLIEVGGTSNNTGNGTLTIGEAPEPPSNDDCADADDVGTLTDGETVQLTGTVEEATTDCYDLDYPEVWIKFTVPDYMDVTIDFCDSSTPINLYASSWNLYYECPCGSYTSYDYNSFCPNSSVSYTWQYLPAGTYYYPIYNSGEFSSYTINIIGKESSPPPTGACCDDDGMTCTGAVTEDSCYVLGGNWMGEDTDCGTYDEETGWSGCYIQEPTGACCYDGGASCVDNLTSEECDVSGGNWKGEGSECGEQDPETGIYEGCEGETSGACCLDDGCQIVTSEPECVDEMNGTWMGFGTDCTDADENGTADVCEEPSTGTCCLENGMACEIASSEEECEIMEGTWMGFGTDCTDADENGIADVCEESDTYDYLPGDANMAAETWPAQTIGGDVTYLVNYFRGIANACMLDGFYASADATGDCLVVGGDVTYLVNYFRGLVDLQYCVDYEPAWPTPSDVPTDAPDGWPDCD